MMLSDNVLYLFSAVFTCSHIYIYIEWLKMNTIGNNYF